MRPGLRGRLERVERSRPVVERPDLAAETAQYGRLVNINHWSRAYESGSKDDGTLVSTLIHEAPLGKVIYQILHVRLRDLM